VEQGQRLVDRALEVLARAVHRFEGTVSEITDDGVVALFGAPVAHEDHAVRACYASLAMHQDFERFGFEELANRSEHMRLRIGLSSGEVVVRAVANDLQVDYLATGQARVRALQVGQLAEPGRTLMTTETRALAEG